MASCVASSILRYSQTPAGAGDERGRFGRSGVPVARDSRSALNSSGKRAYQPVLQWRARWPSVGGGYQTGSRAKSAMKATATTTVMRFSATVA